MNKTAIITALGTVALIIASSAITWNVKGMLDSRVGEETELVYVVKEIEGVKATVELISARDEIIYDLNYLEEKLDVEVEEGDALTLTFASQEGLVIESRLREIEINKGQ